MDILFIFYLQALISAASERLNIQRKSVNVTVGQAIHLTTSYTLPNQFLRFVIEWTVCNNFIVDYYARNCTISPRGIPKWCDGEVEIYQKYKGRVHFYHLNGSLVLMDAQVNDTGFYTIRVSNTSKYIEVWVQENTERIATSEELNVLRKSINVTVGQSIHLPTTYTVRNPFSTYIIEWTICDHLIVDYYARNCSISPHGIPEWCDGDSEVYQTYKDRVQFFHLNASLVLKNAQVNDTGVYTIRLSNATKDIQVWVYPNREHIDENASPTWNPTIFALRIALCFLPVGALVFIAQL